MADDYSFLPEDDATAQSGEHTEQLATQQQWAAMSFPAVPIDPSKFGADWEQTRGAVARTAIALLRFDDRALTEHFMNQPQPLQQAMQAHAGLQRELEYLKAHIEALEMAAARVLCAASRCVEQSPPL